MRLALVTPHVLPFACGNSFLAERLRTGLAARGCDVRVFCTNSDDPGSAAGFRPDIVHSLHAIKPALWLEELFGRIRPPWAITLTGTDYNSPQDYGAPLEMLAGQFAEAGAIVAFHEDARAWLAKHFPGAAGKLSVIPQGVELRQHDPDRDALRHRHGIDADALVFFMAAGIRPVKNISFCLDLFDSVQQRFPAAQLLLAGPVVDAAEADRVFQRAEGQAGFTYLGEISRDAVRDLMAACDIFLNASHHEGMPGAVLEAMAEGIPVLASDVPGNRALVRHGVTGLLVPLAEPVQFLQAACRLAASAGLRQALGSAARIAARSFTVDREIASYEKLYADLLHRPAVV